MRRKCIAASLILFLFFVIGIAAETSAEAAVLEGPWQYRGGEPGRELPDDEYLALHAARSSEWNSFAFPEQPPVLDGQQEIWLTIRITGDEPDQNMLLFSTTGQAVRVWLGARLIYTDGEFRPLHPFGHGSKWHMVRLPAITQDTQLTFQLCADHPYQLGRARNRGDRVITSPGSDLMRTTNLTPHPVCVINRAGKLAIIPPSGQVARLGQSDIESGTYLYLEGVGEISLVNYVMGEIYGLPVELPNHIYIASHLIATKAVELGRHDVLHPAALVKDAKGHVKYCRGLRLPQASSSLVSV